MHGRGGIEDERAQAQLAGTGLACRTARGIHRSIEDGASGLSVDPRPTDQCGGAR
jgi:hypothetical protein